MQSLDEIQSFDVEGVFKNNDVYPEGYSRDFLNDVDSHVTVIPIGQGFYLKFSGMLGFKMDGNVVSRNNISGQTKQAFRNIRDIILEVGRKYDVSVPENPLSCVIYTRADIVNFSENSKAVNDSYYEIKMGKVARTMAGVEQLPIGALVQITAEAYLAKNL